MFKKKHKCQYEMKARRGRYVDTFTAWLSPEKVLIAKKDKRIIKMTKTGKCKNSWF